MSDFDPKALAVLMGDDDGADEYTSLVVKPDPIPGQLPRFDEERQFAFLSYLAETGALASACFHTGVSYASVQKRMEVDEDFRLAVQFHTQLADDKVAIEARRRAMEGVEEPVIYQGQPVYAPRRRADGREVRRALVDDAGEPVLDPGTQAPLTEPILELVTVRKRSDKLLERLLAADPRYSPSTRHQHLHSGQVNAKVGVMVIPATPEDWTAQLHAQALPETSQEFLSDGAHRNLHVIENIEGDSAEEDTFGGISFDFLEG